MASELEAYWRERSKHFEHKCDGMVDQIADLKAVIASLKARLKELEEMQAAVHTAGMAVRNTDSGPNLVSV